MGHITLDDIAADLGVSKTTVSRAMSGKGRISEKTRQRIKDYAREKGYRPNVQARGLAQQRTYNIAVVSPQDSCVSELTFFHKCLVGITDGAEKEGYNVIITVERGNRTDELEQIVENSKADGVILTRTFYDDRRIEYLKSSDIPYVVIGSTQDGDSVRVDNDNYGGSYEMTKRLIEHGVKYPALIGGDPELLVTTQRHDGFMKAVDEAGIEGVLYFPGSLDDGIVTSDIDISMKRDVDCFICMDEEITLMTLAALRTRGIPVPEQISVASLYDSALLTNGDRSVSAVAYDEMYLGQAAAGTLIRLINNETVADMTSNSFAIKLRDTTR
ncbi:MAG: LacI family DNA-binding transcriptional regulator [Lachnospiraceae bacterium]|nr:LacI family DNA-binding transcriptional regulator [Lachnospiraceae bacterium]